MTSDNANKKVAAIVVTFNRKNLLLKNIHSLLKQSFPVDHIFIIDNASTDGTADAVKNGLGNNRNITYIKLDKNIGSSGGFNRGLKRAYSWGADWFWILDDDVAPEPDCLENLLNYQDISKCIHPSKKDINGQEFIWEQKL